MPGYNDYVYFNRLGAVVKGYCSIIESYDGFIAIKLEYDGKEHIIPCRSLIDLIRDARDSKKLSDDWDSEKRRWKP